MKTELELEAERLYPIIPNGHPNVNWDIANKQEGFITGATSKYVEKQKLEFAIEENKSILQMLVLHGNARTQLPVVERIKELEQKLKEYETN